MGAYTQALEAKVAVMVDCDNVSPEILDHALKVAAKFGRIVLRRGYGNHGTLANKWQEALVRLAFTPCLQFQYAAGKNTSDIALALDAQEALFDQRADIFCLVTSDSDFAYLCRKLRERGAHVCIVDEAKSPDALRNASDQFFEWAREPEESTAVKAAREASAQHAGAGRTFTRSDRKTGEEMHTKNPKFILDAVSFLAGASNDGSVTLGALGHYLKRTNPAFSPDDYGYSGLLEMIKTYDKLSPVMQTGGHWIVGLTPA